ncbi:Phenol hydroxylase [Deinococcus gobiensis I-0]|uniref:Phenol hydroxylase n=1 Tax=Deinococcus gobiensis (strain DSM 21396 / JCM 16679 / CGMCC 1.7299 / I-0) TaxID=745776 RepID=H8GTY6_DEIGI|nr:Phenol hydroxylase [Deinococcus gobiensis I-0]
MVPAGRRAAQCALSGGRGDKCHAGGTPVPRPSRAPPTR